MREIRLARDPLPCVSRSRGRSEGRPIKNQTKAAIDAAMVSSAIEWRASFEAAIAITRIKMRAAQIMSHFYDRESGFAIEHWEPTHRSEAVSPPA